MSTDLSEAASRIVEGFKVRRKFLSSRAGVGPPERLLQNRPSIFASLTSRTVATHLVPAPYEGDEAWAFVAAVLTAPTLIAQRALTASIVPPQHVAIVSCYALGALHGLQPPSLEMLDLLDATDYSIVAESLAVAGELPSSLAEICMREANEAVAADKTVGPDVGWLRLRDELLVHAPATGGDLASFARLLQVRKRESVQLVGPDIFSVLQAMIEPGFGLTGAELEKGNALLQRWGLSDLFAQLLILRSLGPFEAEQEYLRGRAPFLGRGAATRRAVQAAAALSVRAKEIPPRPRNLSSVEALAGHLSRIKSSVELADPSTLTDAIIDLYSVDPATMGFLPWDKVSRALIGIPPRGPKTAFLTFLMTDEVVRTRFPLVALRLGKGAFMADLMSLLDSSKRVDPLVSVLTQVRILPPRAAAALTTAVLDKPIIERLASSLPPRLWRRASGPIDRVRVIAMTIQALQIARAKELLPEPIFRRRLEREVAALDFQLLQGQLRTGRVKVAWKELGSGLEALFDDVLPISALELNLPSTLHGLIAERLSAFSAELITSFVVEGSEHSLKQALSSHLRHGVLLPRLLRAFDDAQEAVWPTRPLMDWTDAAVRARLGESGLAVFRLREHVSDRMKRFMDAHLTVERGGSFAGRLETEVADRVARHFAGPDSGRTSRLRIAVLGAARTHLRVLLTEARRELWRSVRKETRADLKALRRSLRGASGEARSYLDSLETYLFEGFDEARRWLAVANRVGPTPPFGLTELVNLHLLSSTLVAWNKLNVTSAVIVDGVERHNLRIDGKYLGLFQEVVRNLLSNAFRESGDRTKTEVSVRLIIENGSMILRCDNKINASKLTDVIERYRETVRQAQRRSTSQAAKDNRSGFQKIRLAFAQTLGVQPQINIPPPTQKRSRFVVDLILKQAPDDLFVVGVQR